MELLSVIRRSPFLDGMARLMDFEGVLVEQDDSEGFEADARNLHGDWERIGANMRAAMRQVAQDPERR